MIPTQSRKIKDSRQDESKIPLTRVLGVTTAILLVIGNMLGTGVFKKIVPMAATGLNESYILGAWILAGIVILFGAFTYAGLAKTTTASGGTYEYLRLAFGDFAGFLFGWGYFTIIGSGSIAAVAIIFSQSVNSMVVLSNPLYHWKDFSIGNSIYPFADSGIKLLALAVIGALTWLNYRGVKKGALMNNVVTIVKVSGVLLLIFFGLLYSHSQIDHTSVAPLSHPASGFPFFSLFFGAMLGAFWAYDGFSDMTAITGEIKNPKRNIPIAIICGVCIVMILYVLANYSFIKALSLSQLRALSENKVAAIVMAGAVMGKAGTLLVSLLIILCSFGALNSLIIFYPRFYYRMAQENMFFKNAIRVHPVFKTPYIALIYSMIWSWVLVFSGTYDILTDMLVTVGLIFYALAAYGLIKMKRKGVILEKIPGYPIAPILFILFLLAISVNTFIIAPGQSAIGLLLICSGLPVYYFFKKKKDKTSSLPLFPSGRTGS